MFLNLTVLLLNAINVWASVFDFPFSLIFKGFSIWVNQCGLDVIVYYPNFSQDPLMSLGKPRKVKQKATVRELKIVHSVSRD